jgi:RNA polymerase sigma-70 factor (ECF subfamily)
MPDLALRELVEQARGGDRAAFETLYARFEASVYRLCYRLLGSDDAAADAAQQVWVNAYERLGNLRHPEAFAAWLRRTVVNVCRRQRTRGAWWRPWSDLGREDAVGDELRDEAPPAPEALARDELSARVQEALGKLSAAHREVVVLHHLEGLPVAEIAETLGVATGTVKSRLGRAREHLERLLAPYVDAEG